MTVTLEVPADAAHVTVARTTVASAATAAGATLGEVEDLRLAVSEACSLLLEDAAGPSIRIRLGTDDGDLVVGFSTELRAPGSRPGSDLAWTLLEALVDEVHWDATAEDQVVIRTRLLLSSPAGP